jgi:predicted TIM-barrel fold metal-dependent hydrolase
MTIDMHTHYAPQELVTELCRRNIPPFIKQNDDGTKIFHMPHGLLNFPNSFTDMEERLRFMATHKIDHQVLSFPGLFGLDSVAANESFPLIQIFNNQVSRLSKEYPNLFSGLASLPMADINLAVQEYKRARNELGLIGAILPNNCFISEEHANRISPIFKAAQEIGGHIFIHPGRRADEVPENYKQSKPIFTDFAPERLALSVQHNVSHCMVTLLFSNFLDAYPNISLHVANLGGTLPMVIERMDNVSLTRTPNEPLPSTRTNRLHVDCSSLGPRSLELAVAIFGANQILLGTDCPIFSTERSLDAIATANIKTSEKELILNDNAAGLLAAYN